MNDKKDEALKLALEALKDARTFTGAWPTGAKAITAIREALAEQPTIKQSLTIEQPTQQQEPVVRWVCKGCRHEYMEAPSSCDCMESREYERVEYFTSPPASKPLTDEFILSLHYGCSTSLKFARAIEAAHGIKE